MKIFIIFVLYLLMGCSIKQAYAPGKPPVTHKKIFKSEAFFGEFKASRPFLFLWPLVKEGQVLNYEELVHSRATIVGLSDEFSEIQTVHKLVAKEVKKLEASFVAMKCGLYCDPNDFLTCDSDPEATHVDEWKVPESSEETEIIDLCKVNQEERTQKAKDVRPLQEKAGAIFGQLGEEIGADNLFISNQFKSKVSDSKIEIFLDGFQKRNFSTSAESKILTISKIKLDKEKGFFTFSVPAIEEEGDQLNIIGEYIFNLEIGNPGDELTLSGEIVFTDYRINETRTGRASMTGTLTP